MRKDELKNEIKDSCLHLITDYISSGLIPKVELNDQTCIYGKTGILNSILTISFIVDLENLIADKYKKQVIIADNRLFSQKSSPFKSIDTFAIYVNSLLDD